MKQRGVVRRPALIGGGYGPLSDGNGIWQEIKVLDAEGILPDLEAVAPVSVDINRRGQGIWPRKIPSGAAHGAAIVEEGRSKLGPPLLESVHCSTDPR